MTLLPSDILALPSGAELRFVEFVDDRGIKGHRYECWRDGDHEDDFKGLHKIMQAAQVGFPPSEPSSYMVDGGRRHEVIYLHNIGELNERAVRPEDLPYLDSWRATVEKFGIEILGAEVLVASEPRRAATRIDVVGSCELSAGPFVANIKSASAHASYGIQSAMESALFSETFRKPRCQPPMRLLFYLNGEGKAARPVIMNDNRELVIAEWAFDNGGARSATNCWRS